MTTELHVVLGAGALGSALSRQLARAGHRVRTGSRSGKPSAVAGVEVQRGDLANQADAVALCEGATSIYFCAGPPYHEWVAVYPGLYANVLAAAAKSGARLVSCENVYPYGRVVGPMTEETPINPCSKKGEVRARLGELLLNAHRDGTAKTALVRGPDYYGPEAAVTTMYGNEVFGRAVAGKKANIVGNVDALHTFCCAADFAGAMIKVGSTDDAMGQTWHVQSPPALTQRAMLELIFAAIGTPMKFQALPGFMLKVLGLFMPIMRELAEMNYQWEYDYDFRSDKIQQRFGVTPTPHAQAVAETVAWFRERDGRR